MGGYATLTADQAAATAEQEDAESEGLCKYGDQRITESEVNRSR